MTHQEMKSGTFEMHQSLKFWREGTALCFSLRMLVVAGSILSISGCLGDVPGRQSYWDGKVKEMCAKDGGVTILERAVLRQDEYNRLPRAGGYVGVSPKELAGGEPLYMVSTEIVIRVQDPRVTRLERLVKDSTSHRTLARIVAYRRSASTSLSLAHQYARLCPDESTVLPALQSLYEVRRDSK